MQGQVVGTTLSLTKLTFRFGAAVNDYNDRTSQKHVDFTLSIAQASIEIFSS